MRTDKWRQAVLILLLVVGAASAAEPTGKASDPSELGNLRATVARQAKEIEQLRNENAALRKELGGVQPRTPTTVPAAPIARRKVRTVLFVIDACTSPVYYPTIAADLAREIEQLQPDQSFNIYMHGSQGVTAMQKGFFVPATPENRRRAVTFLRVTAAGPSHLEDALRFALNLRPDLICVLSYGSVKDAAAALKALGERNTAPKVPIHTTLRFAGSAPAANRHFLWQLARDSGGACTAADGSDADEPVVPVPVAPAPPPVPTSRPSVFRIK